MPCLGNSRGYAVSTVVLRTRWGKPIVYPAAHRWVMPTRLLAAIVDLP